MGIECNSLQTLFIEVKAGGIKKVYMKFRDKKRNYRITNSIYLFLNSRCSPQNFYGISIDIIQTFISKCGKAQYEIRSSFVG